MVSWTWSMRASEYRPISRIARRKDATADERALYEAWLGRPWEEKEDEEPAV